MALSLLSSARRRLRRREGAPPPGPPPPTPEERTASPADLRIIDAARPYTITGTARIQALIDSVRYCVRRGVPGAFAECGVWRGGSVLAMILTLQDEGVDDRDLLLYDTFEGMTAPSELDTSPFDPPALETWRTAEERGRPAWPEYFEDPAAIHEDGVRATLEATGYPPGRIRLVRGPVETTLPAQAPERVALLRLDTDWYESTRHELDHLYPRLSPGGVLIVDDYGHWQGAARAVDEYFAQNPVLLTRIDYTARLAVKL